MDTHLDVQALWKSYRAARATEDRNLLVSHYLPLVWNSASRLRAKLPRAIILDDLQNDGVFGLVDAVETFDPDRGVKFETYCALRIRGAMLDALRQGDWVPRTVRYRRSLLVRTCEQLERDLGRPPTKREVEVALGLSTMKPEMRENFLVDAEGPVVEVGSLSVKRYETDSFKTVYTADLIEDRCAVPPEKHTLDQDLLGLITKGLNPLERCIVGLYYFAELTMKEVGQKLDISESWVSQINSATLRRLAEIRRDMPETLAGGSVVVSAQLRACLVAMARLHLVGGWPGLAKERRQRRGGLGPAPPLSPSDPIPEKAMPDVPGKLLPTMPTTIWPAASNALAVPMLHRYADLLRSRGLTDLAIKAMDRAREVQRWQDDHPTSVALPDQLL